MAKGTFGGRRWDESDVRVRPGNVRIRYVQYPKGLLGPDFQFRCHIMKGLHGFFLPIWHVQHYNLFL